MNDYNNVVDGSIAEVKDRNGAVDLAAYPVNTPVIVEKWPRIVRWGFMIGAAASLWTILVAVFYLLS